MNGMNEPDPQVCSRKEQRHSSTSSNYFSTSGGLMESLVYRLAWAPAPSSETPLPMRSVVVISADTSILENYVKELKFLTHRVLPISTRKEFKDYTVVSTLAQGDAVVIYVPGGAEKKGHVASKARTLVWEVASILSVLSKIPSRPKLFVVLDSAYKGQCLDQAAQYSLYGFARVAASEHPDTWGGLIDNEGKTPPVSFIKDVRIQDVVRVQDGVPQVARLRQFSASEKATSSGKSLLPQPSGTYLVTGGFGNVGLELLEFLVERGAQRIVVVSRRTLPPRNEWSSVSGSMTTIIERIRLLESRGATIHALALDIGLPGASAKLTSAIERLSLPPVLGIVHAAAVPGHGYIKDATSEVYASVMAPKIMGALNLHEAFPPGTLDFFVLFSSISQFIGTPGQSANAASNAFLDSFAIHRRTKGCNTVAIHWTAWRAMGLASNTALIDPELRIAGILDITVEEALQAWQVLSGINTDHAVVTRLKVLDAEEPLPSEVVADVVKRRAALTVEHPVE
ncbi:hypothetical protein P3342_012267 [Pyrenophora teres f. teres]|nr:hypothetical protein P3342_012267 [Pyrenophora teres f. teres]